MSSTASNACTGSVGGLSEILSQRAQQNQMRALFPRTPRLEIVDPYATSIPELGGRPPTPAELAMRRKVEILRYNANAAEARSKTSANRGAARWASLVRLRRLNPSATSSALADSEADCDRLPTPVGAAGVPPNQHTTELAFNPAVPLVYLTNPTTDRNYAQPVPTEEEAGDASVVDVQYLSDVTIARSSVGAACRFMFRPTVTTTSSGRVFARIPLSLRIRGSTARYLTTAVAPTVTVAPVVELWYNETRVSVAGAHTYVPGAANTLTFLLPPEDGADVAWRIERYLGYVEVAAASLPVTALPNAVYTVRVRATIQYTSAFDFSTLEAELVANPAPEWADSNSRPDAVAWTNSGSPGAVQLPHVAVSLA